MNMKHLLSGVAAIAALAVSAPVLAQTSSPPPASTSATPPMHHHGHHVTHAAAHHHKMAPLTGGTANQLNQQELARIQSGSSMPPPPDGRDVAAGPRVQPVRGEQHGHAGSQHGRTRPDAL